LYFSLAMLLINAHAGPSPIHGLGLIADQFIPCGATIWRFQPGFDVAISEAEYQSLPASAQRTIDYYSYHCKAAGMHILSSDDDRFTNHDDNPNSVFIDGVTVATRDIGAGEEITMDYSDFENLPALPRELMDLLPSLPTA
jgi:uncharacterized protein